MTAMGIKQGTKAFGVTTGTPSAGEMNNVTKTLSVEDQKKFGDQDVGDVLNKMADPNYVDPSKKMRTVGNDKLADEESGSDEPAKVARNGGAACELLVARANAEHEQNPERNEARAKAFGKLSGVEFDRQNRCGRFFEVVAHCGGRESRIPL
jgi:hypothetical protein